MPVGSAAIGTKTAEPYRYTMADLESETELSARTIRFYIAQGLLPAARGRGVGATYGPTHLLRLKAIGLLKKDNTPLVQEAVWVEFKRGGLCFVECDRFVS